MTDIWRLEETQDERPSFFKWWPKSPRKIAVVDLDALHASIAGGPSLELDFLGHELVALVVGAPLVTVRPSLSLAATATGTERLCRVSSESLSRFAGDGRSTDEWVEAYRAAVSTSAAPIAHSEIVNGFIVASLRAIARKAVATGVAMYGYERSDP